MSVKDFKPGEAVRAFCPNLKKLEWVKTPTHIPQPRPVTLYGIEVVDEDGNQLPFSAHPKPFRDTLGEFRREVQHR